MQLQGSTIKKPNKLVVDLITVREAAKAYVMLSRVQALSQLIILEDVSPIKMFASEIALKELDRMKNLSIKNHPSKTKIVSCNIRSISKNVDDLMSSPKVKLTEVICLQETWLNVGMTEDFEMDGFTNHFNSTGRGKGIATFYKPCYNHVMDVSCEKYQMTKISSDSTDIINIYRSADASTEEFKKHLKQMWDSSKDTYLVGDFNLCYKSDRNHPILKELSNFGFEQMIKFPTHIGRKDN